MPTVNDRRAFTFTEIINGRLQCGVAIDDRGARRAGGCDSKVKINPITLHNLEVRPMVRGDRVAIHRTSVQLRYHRMADC